MVYRADYVCKCGSKKTIIHNTERSGPFTGFPATVICGVRDCTETITRAN